MGIELGYLYFINSEQAGMKDQGVQACYIPWKYQTKEAHRNHDLLDKEAVYTVLNLFPITQEAQRHLLLWTKTNKERNKRP